MKAEVLKTIKRAEEDARKILEEAAKKKETALDKARKDAAKALEDADEQFSKDNDKALADYSKKLSSEKETILERGKTDANALEKEAKKNSSKAATYVVSQFKKACKEC